MSCNAESIIIVWIITTFKAISHGAGGNNNNINTNKMRITLVFE